MDSALFVLMFLAVAAAIAAFAYYAHMKQRERRQALASLAERLGWRFEPGRDHAHDDEYSQFAIFRQGHSRHAFNTLVGSLDVHGSTCSVKMGDFHYQITTSNGKTTTTQTYLFSYLIVHLPYAGLPDLLIRREGMFDRLKGLMGFHDINFESAEFSRRFFVKSADKRFAYAVIHPPVMELLLNTDAPTIDIEQDCCCLSEGRSTWTPEEFQATLDWACRFFDLWPNHLTASLATVDK